MRTLDFAPLLRSSIGFENLNRLVDFATRGEADAFPPYNIEKLGDGAYRISMAVAGFAQDELDLAVNGQYQIELFSFPNPPARPSKPEALGLRHLAFAVTDIDAAIADLNRKGVDTEPVRVDELTGKRFTFFADPDGLPLELYAV